MRVVSRQTVGGAPQQPTFRMPSQSAPQSADLSSVLARLAEAERNIAQLAQANNALVQETAALKQVLASHKGAITKQAAHFNGLVRQLKVAYTPDPVPVAAPSPRTNAPTRPVSPGAQTIDVTAQAAPTPAGPPQTAAQQVSSAAEQLFYGNGDAAFYEGGEND